MATGRIDRATRPTRSSDYGLFRWLSRQGCPVNGIQKASAGPAHSSDGDRVADLGEVVEQARKLRLGIHALNQFLRQW